MLVVARVGIGWRSALEPASVAVGMEPAINFNHITQFSRRAGFRVAVDAACGIGAGLLGSAVPAFALHSVAPPAPFYSKTSQLREDVNFTRLIDPGSAVASPRWLDDFTTYSDVRDENKTACPLSCPLLPAPVSSRSTLLQKQGSKSR
jgi:hypothetical protein